jgi:hypothetical protein
VGAGVSHEHKKKREEPFEIHDESWKINQRTCRTKLSGTDRRKENNFCEKKMCGKNDKNTKITENQASRLSKASPLVATFGIQHRLS